MKTAIIDNGTFHVWEGVAGILLSDEKVNKLHQFKTIDDCVNWLFLSGFRIAARELNKAWKG